MTGTELKSIRTGEIRTLATQNKQDFNLGVLEVGFDSSFSWESFTTKNFRLHVIIIRRKKRMITLLL